MPDCQHANLTLDGPREKGEGFGRFQRTDCGKLVELDLGMLQGQFGADLNKPDALDRIRSDIDESGVMPLGKLILGPWETMDE